jgi:DNA damage-binding protein 1
MRFVDGELIERFLGLGVEGQEEVVKGLGVGVVEVRELVEGLKLLT